MVASGIGLIITHALAFSAHAPTLSRVAKSRTVCAVHMVDGMEFCKRFGTKRLFYKLFYKQSVLFKR